MQAGPIVVDGTMYFTTERNSYSIDAATCAEKWRVERKLAPVTARRAARLRVSRRAALQRYVRRSRARARRRRRPYALGCAMDVAATPGVSMPMAPIAANGMVFIGNAGGDQTGVTGHVYALDAQDGRVVWRFDVVPDEPAVRATWPNADRLSDHRRCVLDVVRARHGTRRALCAGGQPRARFRRAKRAAATTCTRTR